MKMSFLFTGDRKTAPYVYFIVRLLVFQCKVSLIKDADRNSKLQNQYSTIKKAFLFTGNRKTAPYVYFINRL